MERELGRGGTKGLAAFERAYRDWVVERIRSHRLIPFVAVHLDDEGCSVGSGAIWLREDRPHRRNLSVLLPRIHSIYVDPAARRNGVATQLVREMIRWIRGHGYRRVVLRTTARAEALYVALGFRRNSEMECEWPPT